MWETRNNKYRRNPSYQRLAGLTTCLILACGISDNCAAQEATIDAASVIAELLKSAGNQAVTRTVSSSEVFCHTVHGPDGPYEGCSNRNVQTPKTSQEILTASNLRIVSNSPVKFGAASKTELIDKLESWYQDVQNCTGNQASQAITISKQTTHSESVTVSQSVAHTLGTTIGANASFGGMGVSASVTISSQTTSGTARLNGNQDATSRSGTAQVGVAPHTSVVAEFRVWPIRLRIPYSLDVSVDGDLSQNDKGLKKVTDLIPASKLSFPIKGEIMTEEASEGAIIFHDGIYDGSKCSTSAAVTVSDHSFSDNKPLRFGPQIESVK